MDAWDDPAAVAAVWRAAGTPRPSPAADYAASLHEKHDVPGSLAAHLEWLEQAGFAVGVPHAEGHYVLIAAARG